MTWVRPVTARAVTSAIRFDSVPELQKRMRSMEGKRLLTRWASSASCSLGPPSTSPAFKASRAAAMILGWEWP